MGLIEVTDFSEGGWRSSTDAAQRAHWCCEKLEAGEILWFRQQSFGLSKEDRRFLCTVQQSRSAAIKNISYDANTGRMTGYDSEGEVEVRLRSVFQRCGESIRRFAGRLLSPYDAHLQMDLMSFRPIEEQGRELPLRSRNDLIHIDAFPNRPSHGRRILRFFANLNRAKPRVWTIAENFECLAQSMAMDAGLAGALSGERALVRRLGDLAHAIVHFRRDRAVQRSAYDRFMLTFHDYLKMSTDFQATCGKERIEFPAGSAWVLFTDMVPHAAISGQYALEQTYFLPVSSMLSPQKSPLRILEAMVGSALV